jgi:hypothetical protein
MPQKKKTKDDKVYGTIIATRLNPELVNTLRELAKKERRTLSNMVQVLLYEAVYTREQETK